VYRALARFDEEAVWVTQGWMFVNNPAFWKNAQIEAFISGVPTGKIIILDLDAGSRPIFTSTHNLFGASFVFSLVASFGGRAGMFGTNNNTLEHLKQARKAPNLIGIGMAPEAIELDVIVHELVFDLVWTPDLEINSWLPQFVDARYGGTFENARHAWRTLVSSGIYDSPDEDRPRLTPFVRPSLDVGSVGYDVSKVQAATKLLLTTPSDALTLKADIGFFTLQVLCDKAQKAHQRCVNTYHEDLGVAAWGKCERKFDVLFDEFVRYLFSMKKVLITVFSMPSTKSPSVSRLKSN